MKIDVYSDGSATTKDKPGGYGWVIVIDGKFHSEGSGSLLNATNNDAELEAAIMGLANACGIVNNSLLEEGLKHSVTLVSDSEIVLGWLTGRYRFKQTAKNNKYESFMRLKKMMNVQARWVEGHTGDEWNERCDKLAGTERRRAMGIEPKKKSSKSILMLKAIKEIDTILSKAHENPGEMARSMRQVQDICAPFLRK